MLCYKYIHNIDFIYFKVGLFLLVDVMNIHLKLKISC